MSIGNDKFAVGRYMCRPIRVEEMDKLTVISAMANGEQFAVPPEPRTMFHLKNPTGSFIIEQHLRCEGVFQGFVLSRRVEDLCISLRHESEKRETDLLTPAEVMREGGPVDLYIELCVAFDMYSEIAVLGALRRKLRELRPNSHPHDRIVTLLHRQYRLQDYLPQVFQFRPLTDVFVAYGWPFYVANLGTVLTRLDGLSADGWFSGTMAS